MNYKLNALFKLYLLGRKIKSLTKKHNTDKMLDAQIMLLLRERSYTVSEAAETLSAKISSISEKLLELEKEGYIAKTQSADKRTRNVVLTEKGKGFINIIEDYMLDNCTNFFAPLSEKEIESLGIIVEKLLD